MGEERSSPFVLATGFVVIRCWNRGRNLERALEQWLEGRSRGERRAGDFALQISGEEDQEHESSRGRVLGLYGKKPEIQLCNQADCGTGSWLKPAICVPQRLIAALGVKMRTSNYQIALHKHLCRYFSGARLRNNSWSESHVTSVLPDFHVVEIAPNRVNASWVYVTSGIGGKGVPEDKRCEFLICANENNAENVKLLSMLAWYHLNGATLGEGHVLNIGGSWVPGSTLCSVLISRLWQFGDKLEIVRPREHHVHIYWVLPVTNDEGAFALAHGYQELERLFEDNRIQYTDPMRGACFVLVVLTPNYAFT